MSQNQAPTRGTEKMEFKKPKDEEKPFTVNILAANPTTRYEKERAATLSDTGKKLDALREELLKKRSDLPQYPV